MGFYARHILPFVLDKAMQRAPIADQRAAALAPVVGDTLEIGFGTGFNLPYYPAPIKRLTVLEPSLPMHRRSLPRIEASPIEVDVIGLTPEGGIGSASERFDTVVSTWTLCTIDNVDWMLREVHRVLRPGGRFVFIEHGLAPQPGVQRWQRVLNPLNRLIGGGCNLNREIFSIIGRSPLELDRRDAYYLPHTPRLGGYTYRGTALKTP